MSHNNGNFVHYVGKYRQVRSLGKGAYGEVSLFTFNNRLYAIKRISLMQAMASLYEISVYTSLSHPNIMKPYEYIVDNDGVTINIVMEAIESTLKNFIGTTNTADDIRLVAHGLLAAIDYMHFNRIIHRDLKPRNVLMDGIKPVIIDFGLAKFMYQDSGPMSDNVQTYTYRAPEVFAGTGYNQLIDEWSIGIMLLEMFLGHSIFENYTESELKKFLLGRDFHSLRRMIESTSIPLPARDVLRGLLERDPARRMSASRALQSPWFHSMDPAYLVPYTQNLILLNVVPSNAPHHVIENTLGNTLIRQLGLAPIVLAHANKLWHRLHNSDRNISNVGPLVIGRLMDLCLKISSSDLEEKDPKYPLTIQSPEQARLLFQLLRALSFNIITE